MEMISLCGIALTAAVSALALKKHSPETSFVIALAGGVILLLSVLSQISPFVNQIFSLMNEYHIDTDYGKILIKTVGVCIVCQFTSDCCRDSGQSSLASKVELGGKLTILLAAMPLFEKILSAVSGLLYQNMA